MSYNQIHDPEYVSGEIIRILKKESKYGNDYYDVQFKLLQTGSFLRSCIYTGCRNFTNWKNLLQVGNILSNLKLIDKFGRVFVDADSIPNLIKRGDPGINQELRHIRKQNEILQGSLF